MKTCKSLLTIIECFQYTADQPASLHANTHILMWHDVKTWPEVHLVWWMLGDFPGDMLSPSGDMACKVGGDPANTGILHIDHLH